MKYLPLMMAFLLGILTMTIFVHLGWVKTSGEKELKSRVDLMEKEFKAVLSHLELIVYTTEAKESEVRVINSSNIYKIK